MALAPVLPERLSAGSYLSLCATYLGGFDDVSGEVWVQPEPNNGGWGAGQGIDGASGLIATVDGDTYNYPVELVESKVPLLVEQYSLNTQASGGDGQWRGGIGCIREYRTLGKKTFFHASMGRNRVRPWGMKGGSAGTNNYVEIEWPGNKEVEIATRVANVPLPKGSRVRIITGRGGGYGDPKERPTEQVREDVRNGYITEEQANQVYGVTL